MDGLLEALQTGAAFRRKRGPRQAGNNSNDNNNNRDNNNDDRLSCKQKSTLTIDQT